MLGMEVICAINITDKVHHTQLADEDQNIHFSVNTQSVFNDLLLLIKIQPDLLYFEDSSINFNLFILVSLFEFFF